MRSKLGTAFLNNHRNAVASCLLVERPATIAKLPKLSPLERTVNRVLRHSYGAAQISQQIEDVVLPKHLRLTKTVSPEDFVAVDTGANDSESIIIFASKKDLCRLKCCNTWLCDGTFKEASEVFYQLWVVHGLYKGRVLPLLTALW